MITRFKYNFTFKDFLYSLGNINSPREEFPQLQNYFGADHIYFANQARVSLRVLLSSLGLKKDAVIGVQAYNCINVFESIERAGYKALFIDVNDDYVLDLKDLANKINTVDALIVTHTFGIPA